MIKESNVASGVRVKLNTEFSVKCIGDTYLKDEPVLFISDSNAYNDAKGHYVLIRGGSLMNSGYAYLNELDLEFPVPTKPLYQL
jgi:hypothetical protein